MRNLALIIPLLLLFACNDNPASVDSEYPKEVGSWLITSETEAEWQGTELSSNSSVASGDTVLLEKPTDHALSLKADTTNHDDLVMLTFIDSTITKSDSISVEHTRPGFNDAGNIFSWSGRYVSVSNERILLEFGLFYSCVNSQQAENLWVNVMRDDSTTIRNYKIKVNGIVDVVDTIVPRNCD